MKLRQSMVWVTLVAVLCASVPPARGGEPPARAPLVAPKFEWKGDAADHLVTLSFSVNANVKEAIRRYGHNLCQKIPDEVMEDALKGFFGNSYPAALSLQKTFNTDEVFKEFEDEFWLLITLIKFARSPDKYTFAKNEFKAYLWRSFDGDFVAKVAMELLAAKATGGLRTVYVFLRGAHDTYQKVQKIIETAKKIRRRWRQIQVVLALFGIDVDAVLKPYVEKYVPSFLASRDGRYLNAKEVVPGMPPPVTVGGLSECKLYNREMVLAHRQFPNLAIDLTTAYSVFQNTIRRDADGIPISVEAKRVLAGSPYPLIRYVSSVVFQWELGGWPACTAGRIRGVLDDVDTAMRDTDRYDPFLARTKRDLSKRYGDGRYQRPEPEEIVLDGRNHFAISRRIQFDSPVGKVLAIRGLLRDATAYYNQVRQLGGARGQSGNALAASQLRLHVYANDGLIVRARRARGKDLEDGFDRARIPIAQGENRRTERSGGPDAVDGTEVKCEVEVTRDRPVKWSFDDFVKTRPLSRTESLPAADEVVYLELLPLPGCVRIDPDQGDLEQKRVLTVHLVGCWLAAPDTDREYLPVKDRRTGRQGLRVRWWGPLWRVPQDARSRRPTVLDLAGPHVRYQIVRALNRPKAWQELDRQGFFPPGLELREGTALQGRIVPATTPGSREPDPRRGYIEFSHTDTTFDERQRSQYRYFVGAYWDPETLRGSLKPLPELPELPPEPDGETEMGVALLDANPANPELGLGEARAHMGSEQLVRLIKPDVAADVLTTRSGTVADGTSRLLVRVSVPGPGNVTFALIGKKYDNGSLKPLAGDGPAPVVETDSGHYAFGLYTPPFSFGPAFEPDPDDPGKKPPLLEGTVEYREVPFRVSYRGQDGTEAEQERTLTLARPPVVLVHDAFDRPEHSWESNAYTTHPTAKGHGRISMKEFLTKRGFAVFTVDYQKTNGANDREGQGTSFCSNRRVLWENPGGIREALAAFRDPDTLDLAVCQVDVVGHGLGGLLARVWASESNYYEQVARDEADRYRRFENFNEGDINRLVTIATPHFGSDLAGLLVKAQETVQATDGVRDPRLHALPPLWWFKWWQGRVLPGAVHDQAPLSEALKGIGPTPIPAHAIYCHAQTPDLQDFGACYLEGLVKLWQLLKEQPQVVRTFLKERGQEDMADDAIGQYLQRYEAASVTLGRLSASWAATDTIEIKDMAMLRNMFRHVLFGRTRNDMVVRIESQVGGLMLHHTSDMPRVLHGFAPRYEKVQKQVARLLGEDMAWFEKDGFPAADRECINVAELPECKQDAAERNAAIATSNIVPSHAEAISLVARKHNVIIFMRPVNKHSTGLIASGVATKDMHVKGKSSNWGPHRGLVACRQHFSKLVDDIARVPKFNDAVKKCLEEKRAVAEPLAVTAAGQWYDVRVLKDDPKTKEEAYDALVLRRQGTSEYHDWRNVDDKDFSGDRAAGRRVDHANDSNTEPFLVLADRYSRRRLTADYDLLAIATTRPYRENPFDVDMGTFTDKEIAVWKAINMHVRLYGNYDGGKVCHHGPENRFPCDPPNLDYPITVFTNTGYVHTITEGPPRMKDWRLKERFDFWKKANRILEPCRTWNWGAYDRQKWPTGWDPNDKVPKQRAATEPTAPVDNPFDSDEGDDEW